MLRGTLRDVSVNIFDILEFREIGVELLGSRLYDAQTEKMKWHFGFGFFGHLHVTMPRSVVPLQVDYKLRKILSVWELELCLKNEDWVNVMGIEGLAVSLTLILGAWNYALTNPGVSSPKSCSSAALMAATQRAAS